VGVQADADKSPLWVNSDGLVPLVTVPLIPPITDNRTTDGSRLETGRSQAHTMVMAAPDAPVPPYRIRVRRCTIHLGRFRWDIIVDGTPVESSPDSYFSRREAKAVGLARLKELVIARGTDPRRPTSA
jgi:hypothetical protein